MGVGPRGCRCHAVGRISLGSTGGLDINICPNCFLTESSLTIDINDSVDDDYSFVSDKIDEPICNGDTLETNGTGNLSGTVSGKLINGTVNFTIEVSADSVRVLFSGGDLGTDTTGFIIVGMGSGIPVNDCSGLGVQPLRKTEKAAIAKMTMIRNGELTKQITIGG